MDDHLKQTAVYSNGQNLHCTVDGHPVSAWWWCERVYVRACVLACGLVRGYGVLIQVAR